MTSRFDHKVPDKSAGSVIGPKSWQDWLVMVAMILIGVGTAVAATRLSDLPRWMPLIVIVLTVAGSIILLSVTHEKDGE